MQYYIYKITNQLNGKIYIGQHLVPKYHETFRRYMGSGIAITEAYEKYGRRYGYANAGYGNETVE